MPASRHGACAALAASCTGFGTAHFLGCNDSQHAPRRSLLPPSCHGTKTRRTVSPVQRPSPPTSSESTTRVSPFIFSGDALRRRRDREADAGLWAIPFRHTNGGAPLCTSNCFFPFKCPRGVTPRPSLRPRRRAVRSGSRTFSVESSEVGPTTNAPRRTRANYARSRSGADTMKANSLCAAGGSVVRCRMQNDDCETPCRGEGEVRLRVFKVTRCTKSCTL